MIQQLRRRLVAGILIGVIVVAALVVASDADALLAALREFDWRLLPAILALTLLNYALRFVKWQYYMRLLGVQELSRRDSALIFVAGFTMVMTPGKVGELLKSYLLRIRAGVSMARSAPAVFAERLSDGFALLILAGIGTTVFRHGWQLLAAGAVISLAGMFVLQQEALVHRVLGLIQRTRVGSQRAVLLIELYDSARKMLRLRPFSFAVTIGVASWFGECVAFFLVLVGLGIDPSWTLLLAATFVFAAGGWIGGASMLPGGLGAAELSFAALLLLVVDDPAMTSTLAGTATLLIRFATLWFGVLLGVVALARVVRWVDAQSAPKSPYDAVQQPGAAIDG